MSLSNLYAEKIFSEHPISLWALDEEFTNSTNPSTVPGVTSVSKGFKATSYGSSDGYGWYVSDGAKYYADNSGVPMVYGASNVTGLYPYADQLSTATTLTPSLIVPGFGFMNTSGQYKDFTLEAWVRITANTINGPFRIIGPVASNDGIYVNGSYITLKVNNNTKSHFIDDWQRPMLIDLSLNKNGASLMINGEMVISMIFDASRISFPPSISSENKDNNWIGFYLAKDAVSLMDVDCIAIYPTVISETMAKRRFAYGQAIQYPQSLLSSYGGSAAIVDFSFSNYSKSYNYPQIGKWSNGVMEGMVAKSDYLSVPAYELPTVKVYSGTRELTISEWEDSIAYKNTNAENYSFSMTPKVGANKDESFRGYMKFDSLDILTNPIRGIAGIFDLGVEPEVGTSNQTLLKIQNNYSLEHIEIEVEPEDQLTANIYVTFFSPNVGEVELAKYSGVTKDANNIFVGLDFETMASHTSIPDDFFDSPGSLSLYIAASKEIIANDSVLSNSKAYLGNIHKIHLLTQTSLDKLPPEIEYSTNGAIFSSEETNISFDAVMSFIGSYTLFFTKLTSNWDSNTTYKTSGSHLDIAVDSSWQDYVPLSYMIQKRDDGEYTIDFMQFNVSHFSVNSINELGKIVTSDDFRAYISFQSSEASTYENFDSVELLSKNNVIKPVGNDWLQKKYEIRDNTIIYPPSNTELKNIVLVVNFELKVRGIRSNPTMIKSLQISPFTLNKNSNTLIGTRLGLNFKEYHESGVDNPFLIYKESSPYLYMTNKSGIKLAGDFSTAMDRGLALVINPSKAPKFYLSTMQMFVNYNNDKFSETKEPFFEIKNKKSGYEHLKFYIISDNAADTVGKIEGYVVAADLTETKIDSAGISYYIDGHQYPSGEDPQLELNEWHGLSINFPKLLDFSDNDEYTINLTGPVLVNNISYYRVGEGTVSQKTTKVSWSTVAASPNTWDTWKQTDTWSTVLYESFENISGINQDTIYDILLGTNKIVVDTDTSSNTLKLRDCSYVVYDKIEWQSEVIKPV